MRLVFALILVAVLILGCAAVTYDRIWLPTYPRKQLRVNVVEYDRWEDLQAQYWAHAEHEGEEVHAWSKWTGSGWCELHVMRVTQANYRQQIPLRGHELTHCTHGNWH
jgi:hypothetical protein